MLGRIQTGSYKNREGVTVYTTDVVADRVEFLGGGNGGQGGQSSAAEARDSEAVSLRGRHLASRQRIQGSLTTCRIPSRQPKMIFHSKKGESTNHGKKFKTKTREHRHEKTQSLPVLR